MPLTFVRGTHCCGHVGTWATVVLAFPARYAILKRVRSCGLF